MRTPIFKIYTPLGERFPTNQPFICRFGRTEQSIVTVCRSAVLAPGLFIVARLAKALPVVTIPEQILVSSMWFYMIHHCCLCISPKLHALGTERMLSEVCLARLLPCGAVATPACCPCVLRMQRLMLSTIFLSVFNKHTAAGMLARCIWSVWQFNSSHAKRTFRIRTPSICYSNYIVMRFVYFIL